MTDATEEFGPYLVYERLGQGGMATVHRAEKRGVGIRRPVALKRLFPHVAADPELVKLFVDEARLASHLHHANVAQTYELGRVGNTFFIAMEYAAGPTLAHIVRQCQGAAVAIPLPITVNILGQVCEALDYAHNLCDESGQALRIIHRDVSPANIIVTITGLVKLIDFGIAKATTSRVKTQTGFIKGKFGYIAPEYITGKIDARVDLFALGVVAHEMLTSRRLFEGKDDFDTMANIREMTVSPPSHWNPLVPPELDETVMTALERDPAKRWQTAGAMQSALASAARGLGMGVGGQQLVEWVEWAFDQPQDSQAMIRADAITGETAVGRNAPALRRRGNGVTAELARAQAELAAASARAAVPERAPATASSDADETVPHERIALALSDFETLTPPVKNPPIAPPPPAAPAWTAHAPTATTPGRPAPPLPAQATRDAAPSRPVPASSPPPPREVAPPPREVAPPPPQPPSQPQPSQPRPSQPQQPQPQPSQPRPSQPQQSQPQQSQPRPSQPQQSQPRPSQPQQSQPRPSQPQPSQPQPSQPQQSQQPSQPQPSQPQPSVAAWSRPQAPVASPQRRPRPALPFEGATRRPARPHPQPARLSRTFESAPPPPPLPAAALTRSSGLLDTAAASAPAPQPPPPQPPQPSPAQRPSGPAEAMVAPRRLSREYEVAPPASTFDEPGDLPATQPEPTAQLTPRARARSMQKSQQDPTGSHDADGPEPSALTTRSIAAAERRPIPRDRRRRHRPEPGAASRTRHRVVWLILLMVVLGAGAMAVAYYWPADL